MIIARDFVLPPELEAHEPPEARGLTRDGVRLLVGRRSSGEVSHHQFGDLPRLLTPGDVLVVNTSATLPAAVPVVDSDLRVHFSTPLPGGEWLVELRRITDKASVPYSGGVAGQRFALSGGATVHLRETYSDRRLWTADVDTDVEGLLHRVGVPIRYGYVPRPWPLEYYQTVFASEAGSAEMPSAARPFTDRLVTRLVSAGIIVVPILLHTGVASPEAHERPYPELYSVPASTARVVSQARAAGSRIIAVGTTVVRAVESAMEGPSSGWTDLVITPERGVRVVDGLLTGFHEPRASHLDILEAMSGHDLLAQCYDEALRGGYLWHEFGDLNLLLS